MTYRFLSPALRDLTEAINYYDTASPGLGEEFIDEIEATIRRITLNPEAGPRSRLTTVGAAPEDSPMV